jgi:hypothetical protein
VKREDIQDPLKIGCFEGRRILQAARRCCKLAWRGLTKACLCNTKINSYRLRPGSFGTEERILYGSLNEEDQVKPLHGTSTTARIKFDAPTSYLLCNPVVVNEFTSGICPRVIQFLITEMEYKCDLKEADDCMLPCNLNRERRRKYKFILLQIPHRSILKLVVVRCLCSMSVQYS